MRNRTYGGVRGRKTKAGRKTFRFPPTRLYNIKALTFETVLHQLSDKVQLKLTAGKATPKEWYVVPLPIIDEAVTRFIQGERICYDHHLKRLILSK